MCSNAAVCARAPTVSLGHATARHAATTTQAVIGTHRFRARLNTSQATNGYGTQYTASRSASVRHQKSPIAGSSRECGSMNRMPPPAITATALSAAGRHGGRSRATRTRVNQYPNRSRKGPPPRTPRTGRPWLTAAERNGPLRTPKRVPSRTSFHTGSGRHVPATRRGAALGPALGSAFARMVH